MPPEPDATIVDDADVRAQLRHVLWIGGGSLAGKSTVARRLAAHHGLRVVATDDSMGEHARRCSPEQGPQLAAFTAMDMDERWVQRSPATMLETFPWFRGEAFDQIVADLLRLPREPGVVVEGFRLLPRCVAPLLTVHSQAVWLLPTPDRRRAAADRRGSGWEFLDRTSDPARARRNLLERDRLFTDRVREEAVALGLPVIEVGLTTAEDDLVERAQRMLGL